MREGGKTNLLQNLHSAEDACNENAFSGGKEVSGLTLSISLVGEQKPLRASLLSARAAGSRRLVSDAGTSFCRG